MQSYEISKFSQAHVDSAIADIIREYENKLLSEKIPVGILLGGQPGSGKSTFHAMQNEERPNIFIVNGDDYRHRHPNFDEIQAKYGDDSVSYTQSFANAVVEGLIEKVSSEKYSLIIEGTLRDYSVPLKTYELLKNKGYKVELHVMAVSKEESWQGTIDRYNEIDLFRNPTIYVKMHHGDENEKKCPANAGRNRKTESRQKISEINRCMA